MRREPMLRGVQPDRVGECVMIEPLQLTMSTACIRTQAAVPSEFLARLTDFGCVTTRLNRKRLYAAKSDVEVPGAIEVHVNGQRHWEEIIDIGQGGFAVDNIGDGTSLAEEKADQTMVGTELEQWQRRAGVIAV